MILIYMLLSFSIVIGASALIWKLAARLLHYGGVTWPLAFLAAATIVFVLGFVRGVLGVLGVSAPAHVGIIVSLPLPLALGAWCFHDRATSPDGTPVDWFGAFKLSGVAIALNALIALLLIALAMTMSS